MSACSFAESIVKNYNWKKFLIFHLRNIPSYINNKHGLDDYSYSDNSDSLLIINNNALSIVCILSPNDVIDENLYLQISELK